MSNDQLILMEMADGHLFKQIIKKMKSVAGNSSTTLVLVFTPQGLMINVMRKNGIALYHIMLESRAMANYIYRAYDSYDEETTGELLPYKIIRVEFPKLIAAIDTSQKDQGVLLRWPFDNGTESRPQYGKLGVLIKGQVVMTRNSVQIIQNTDAGESAPMLSNCITIPYRSADIKQKLQNIYKNGCNMSLSFSFNNPSITDSKPSLIDRIVCSTSSTSKSSIDEETYNQTHEAVDSWKEYNISTEDMDLNDCSFSIPSEDVKYIKSIISVADKSATCFFVVPVSQEVGVMSISGYIKEYGYYQIFIKKMST